MTSGPICRATAPDEANISGKISPTDGLRPMNLRRWRGAALAALAVVAVTLPAVVAGLPALGRFLVVSDTLQPSDAIIVLDGRTPARELEAAALYHHGLAPRVVLARARDPYVVAHALAGEPTPQARALRVLTHMKVPREGIETLERVVENTAEGRKST